MNLHRHRGLLAFILAVTSTPSVVMAETYPNRPVHVIVGFSPGGTTDIATRIVASKMADELGVPVVVDSKPGASTTIAADVVVKSAPDGYTLFVAGNANAANVALQPRLPFDIQTDFAPVGLAATSASVLVVSPSQGINNITQLIDAAKGHPGEISFASSGNGAVSHIAGEVFSKATGVKLTHVAYKGSSQAILDVIAGRVQIMFAPISTALPFVRDGKLKPLAVTSPERSPNLPEIPTLKELGIANAGATIWFGLVAPRGTPQDRLDILRTDLNRALDDPRVKSQLALQGMESLKGDAGVFSAKMASEISSIRGLQLAPSTK